MKGERVSQNSTIIRKIVHILGKVIKNVQKIIHVVYEQLKRANQQVQGINNTEKKTFIS